MTRRRRILLAAAVLVTVALLAHGWWWYAPRVRGAVPEAGGLGERLLAEGTLPVALWMPYPHQNLGALEDGFGGTAEERRRFLAAVARLADLPEPALPGFGPFTAPPSRELVALSDEAGERVFVAARVYPAIAVLARLAGKVAGNPWLAGGEVEAFGGTARVAWDGTLWTVGNVALEEVLPAAGGAGGAAAAVPDGEVLATLRLARPASFLAAGTYRLEEVPDGLRLASAAPPPAAAVEALAAVPVGEGGVALFAVAGAGATAEEESGALALFPAGGDGGLLGGLLADLPGAAVWYRPGSERFRLPAESLLGRSRQEAGAGSGGWAVVATGSASLAAAGLLTPRVDRLASDASAALVADPGRALAAVDAALRILRVVPLTSREEVRRWEDWGTALTPVAGFERLTVLAVRADAAAGGAAAGGTPGVEPGDTDPAAGSGDRPLGTLEVRLRRPGAR